MLTGAFGEGGKGNKVCDEACNILACAYDDDDCAVCQSDAPRLRDAMLSIREDARAGALLLLLQIEVQF